MPAVLGVQQIHGVEGRATPGEEVNDEGVGVELNKETQGISNRIYTFREGKIPVGKSIAKKSRAILGCVVKAHSPLSSRYCTYVRRVHSIHDNGSVRTPSDF